VINPTRIPFRINPFASAASAVVFPEPKNPPENISFTGFLTDSFLGVLIFLPPVRPERIEKLTRSYLKKVFWSHFFVGRSVQILEIPVYSSGLNLASASSLKQNPFFEIASNQQNSI